MTSLPLLIDEDDVRGRSDRGYDNVTDPGDIDVTFETPYRDEPVEPAIVTDYEYNDDGTVVSFSDQCGHTESNDLGTTGVKLTLNGYFRPNQVEPLQKAKSSGDKLRVVSPLYTGPIIIKDLTIKQVDKKNKLEVIEDGERIIATSFPFTMKLKSPTSF